MAVLLAVLALLPLVAARDDENMNGLYARDDDNMNGLYVRDDDNMNGLYSLSSTPGSPDPRRWLSSLLGSPTCDYPGGAVDYFDLHSPTISSTYAEVFWTMLDPVPLPDEIVKKYKGKGMAIIGFETDQVRRTPDGDVPLPINVAYNHHFESTLTGSKSVLERVELGGPDDPRRRHHSGHGSPLADHAWVVRELAPGIEVGGQTQDFGGANGGEYRKSFHGYAPGYAQVIESPTTWHITPMQIDTFNRDEMDLEGQRPFAPGPLPSSALSPGSAHVPATSASDVLYSGLLECPVTTRIRNTATARPSATGTCLWPRERQPAARTPQWCAKADIACDVYGGSHERRQGAVRRAAEQSVGFDALDAGGLLDHSARLARRSEMRDLLEQRGVADGSVRRGAGAPCVGRARRLWLPRGALHPRTERDARRGRADGDHHSERPCVRLVWRRLQRDEHGRRRAR